MYLFIVSLILTALAALAYYLYIRHKGEKLTKLQSGICPECGEQAVHPKSQRGGGCSGTTNITYRCDACGYEEDFNVAGGGCGI